MKPDELLRLEDLLRQQWSLRADIRTAFGTQAAFIHANVVYFESESLASGRGVFDLIGTLPVVEAP